MAAGYDGSIRIDTAIDSKGFNAGTKQMTKGLNGISASLKKVAVAVGIAFGAAQIIRFGQASVKAATEFENAMIGVRSIVEGQGRDFQKAQKYIQEYISDGLVPATAAANAYKNLAMRGYDDQQIQTVLEALKNSAAFGRQASLTMGEAVQGATEGLKNENSVLVDNAGVTKNVSMMWKDYADSIGVGVNSLTKSQKIQAEVLGIMEETRFQMGDAAKIAETYSGQVMRMTFNFNNLKIAVGNALIPIAQAVLPSINAIIEALTRLANKFAAVSQALFGKQVSMQNEVAASGNAAEKSQENLAKATKGVGDASKKTNKELKNSLASFDELNILASNTADAMSGVSDVDVAAGVITKTSSEVPVDMPGSSEFIEKLDRIKKSLQDIGAFFALKFGAPVGKALGDIKRQFERWIDTLKGVFKDIGSLWEPFLAYVFDVLVPLWQKVIPIMGSILAGLLETGRNVFQGIWDAAFPILQWFVVSGLPLIAEFSYGIWLLLDQMFQSVKLIFDTLWSGAIEPGLKLASKIIVDFLDMIKTFWDKWGTKILGGLSETISKLTQLFRDFWDKYLGPIITDGLAMLTWLWDNHIKNIVQQVLDFVGKLTMAAIDIFNKFILPIINALVNKFGPTFSIIVQTVNDVIGTLLATVIDIAAGLIKALGGIIDFIAGVFTGDWKRAWEGVKSIFSGIFDGVVGIFKGAINLIIDAMNFLIRKLNKVSIKAPDWAADLAGLPKGASFGFNIPTIPKLATGAVIPPNGEFLAILGDQKNGRNLEAPEDLIRKIVREESGNRDVIDMLQNIHSAIREGKILVVDKQALGKVVSKAQAESFRAAGLTTIPV